MFRPPRIAVFLAALVVLLLAGPLGPGAAAAAPARASVVAGDPAVPGSFPYLAFVYSRGRGETEACSGTVVASNVVLTAAHCVADGSGAPRPAGAFRVVTGEVDWEARDRVLSTVAAVAVHPEYAASGERANWADAAVLQLAQPVAAPPVRLAGGEAWSPGSPALIAGWGKLAASQSGPAATLHSGTTAVQPAELCATAADHFDPGGELCVLDTADRARSACSGDSGGPLLVVAPGTEDEPLEIGIASNSASDSCAPSSPQYYTRADLVAPWVAAEIAALAPTANAAVAAILPRLGARRAKALARAALLEAFGAGFERGSGYRAECEAIEPSRRACAVGWDRGHGRFAGWVTVYYALEADRVVWRYTMRVERTRARAA
ncbi:MAG TPA: serine protease [Solirubrobacterales bacterium]|nr:serine protease [Solirubrobacterales bacterium]